MKSKSVELSNDRRLQLPDYEVVERMALLSETCADRRLARRMLVAQFVFMVVMTLGSVVLAAAGAHIAAGACATPGCIAGYLGTRRSVLVQQPSVTDP